MDCIYCIIFNVCCCMEYKKSNCILSPTQKKKFKKAVDYVNAVLEIIDSRSRWENGDTISTTIYNYAMANTYNFFNDVIQGSRNDERFFASDIQAQLNHENLLKKVIGRDVIDKFYKGLDECQKRILFTLDGFDVASDMFRKNS